MTQSVKTAAFVYLNPEAARVFLEIKHYRVHIFAGTDLPELYPDEKNVVIVPDYRLRGGLAPIADGIYRLLIYPGNDDPVALARLGVPMVDAQEENGQYVQLFPAQTPSYYIDQIEQRAVPLPLAQQEEKKTLPPVAKPEKPLAEGVESIDAWLDVLDKWLPAVVENLEVEVEYPLCLFLVGETGSGDFQNAMKALVAKGADKRMMRAFYLWVREQEKKISPAIKELLFPTGQKQPDVKQLASNHAVSEKDLALLEAIYYEMKGDDEDVDG